MTIGYVFEEGNTKECLTEKAQCDEKWGYSAENNTRTCVRESLCPEDQFVTSDNACMTEQQCLE